VVPLLRTTARANTVKSPATLASTTELAGSSFEIKVPVNQWSKGEAANQVSATGGLGQEILAK
jgi:hypothetical protein